MIKKVLVTYGDRWGPIVVPAVEDVLRTVAPDLEILHGRIGADAYENVGYALPPETMDLVSECDAVISGPTDMDGIPERDPLVTIKKQMGLFLEYFEYFRLSENTGQGDINATILGPTAESRPNVYETESLDGISSEFYTGVDLVNQILSTSTRIAELKKTSRVDFVSEGMLYPTREKLLSTKFEEIFGPLNFSARKSLMSEVVYRMINSPSNIDMVICDAYTFPAITSMASGLVGDGLMSHAFIGPRKGLFTSAPVFGNKNPDRLLNPTSMILSIGLLLLNKGDETGYRLVNEAVSEMYRTGRTTPDMGGTLNAMQFAENVKEYIKTKRQI